MWRWSFAIRVRVVTLKSVFFFILFYNLCCVNVALVLHFTFTA